MVGDGLGDACARSAASVRLGILRGGARFRMCAVRCIYAGSWACSAHVVSAGAREDTFSRVCALGLRARVRRLAPAACGRGPPVRVHHHRAVHVPSCGRWHSVACARWRCTQLWEWGSCALTPPGDTHARPTRPPHTRTATTPRRSHPHARSPHDTAHTGTPHRPPHPHGCPSTSGRPLSPRRIQVHHRSRCPPPSRRAATTPTQQPDRPVREVSQPARTAPPPHPLLFLPSTAPPARRRTKRPDVHPARQRPRIAPSPPTTPHPRSAPTRGGHQTTHSEHGMRGRTHERAYLRAQTHAAAHGRQQTTHAEHDTPSTHPRLHRKHQTIRHARRTPTSPRVCIAPRTSRARAGEGTPRSNRTDAPNFTNAPPPCAPGE
ncbi:hypothetical protein C8J57DRAFT_1719035 [Mycena rebaudengoi]|nr:hypothetical protein C8J57DRAFT_1719035 [Mycena rebaudengoi]